MKPAIVSTRIVWFALLVTLCAYQSVHAHKLGQSYIFLKVYSQEIQGRVEMTMGDLNTALGLDFRTDLSVTRDEIAVHIDAIKAYMLEKISMTSNGVPLDMRPTGYRLLSTSFAQYVLVEFTFGDLPSPTESIDIDYAVLFDREPEHRGLLVIEHNWRTNTFNNESTVSLTARTW